MQLHIYQDWPDVRMEDSDEYDVEIVDTLGKLLREDSDDIRAIAIGSLGYYRRPEAVRLLIECVTGGTKADAALAINALQHMLVHSVSPQHHAFEMCCCNAIVTSGSDLTRIQHDVLNWWTESRGKSMEELLHPAFLENLPSK